MGLYGPYYDENGGTPGYNFTAEFWANELGQAVAQMDGFDVDMYQFVSGDNLQFQARKVGGITIGESDAQVILNASVLNIDRQAGSVTSLTVGVMTADRSAPTQAGEFRVSVDVYVSACGGVANARLLLLSGFGNDNEHVGRYFMGQPIAIGAQAVFTQSNYLSGPELALLQYQNPNQVHNKYPINQVAGLLTPNAEVSRKNQTGGCWFQAGGTGQFYHELLSEYTSQVTLSEDEDLFGQLKTKIDWQLNENAGRNYEVLTRLFETAVSAKGGGPVTIEPWTSVRDLMVINGHHLGTTRMSATQEDGVVDKNLKLHGVDNLYVAGSSIWASAGISNPTFSIITFSIRLADHLKQQLIG